MTGFLDTNVLAYAFQRNDHRQPRAKTLLDGSNRIAVQSLNEFALVAIRKLRMEWAELDAALAALATLTLPPVALTLEIHRHGLALCRQYQLSVYDSMLVAAALHARCSTFWSEDLHDGLVIDGRLTIRNPFV